VSQIGAPFLHGFRSSPSSTPFSNKSYAVQIARDWNTRDGGTGYVLRFEVDSGYLSKYPVQIAGSRQHREYRIPAEELAEFNAPHRWTN
jgi:hypothetical protein